MRILFITHYYYPEGNAPATRIHQMTKRWAAAGHEVAVVTAVPNVPSGVPYDGYRNRWRQDELIDGVKVRRVWTYLAANAGKRRRIASYLSFMLTAVIAGLLSPRPDVVISTSPQFFCGWAGRIVALLRRLPFVLEIRDLWPESIVAVGAMRRSRIIRMLEFLEKRLYRAASIIVTVGEGYESGLISRNVSPSKIRLIPNGVDLAAFDPQHHKGDQIRENFGLDSKFVCSFVGTIGMSSGLDVVIRAARILKARSQNEVRFLLVGDGSELRRLRDTAEAENLDAIVFTGRLSKELMPSVLAATDVCLVHLTNTALFKTVMPSKIFEATAMAKAIILGVGGLAAEWLRKAGAGIEIEPENEKELLDAIGRFLADDNLAKKFGQSGRAFVEQHYDYDLLATQYLGILKQLPNVR